MSEIVAVASAEMRSRWGYHACSWETYQKLRRLSRAYWQDVRRQAAADRWDKKTVNQRGLRPAVNPVFAVAESWADRECNFRDEKGKSVVDAPGLPATATTKAVPPKYRKQMRSVYGRHYDLAEIPQLLRAARPHEVPPAPFTAAQLERIDFLLRHLPPEQA